MQSSGSQPTSLKSILILSFHLRLGLPKDLFPLGFPTKTLYTFLDCSVSATCPAHLSSLDLKWTDKIKKCSCARKSGRRENNAGTDKEEENKLAGPLARKELPAEGYKREESLWVKKISDDRQHYDKWTV